MANINWWHWPAVKSKIERYGGFIGAITAIITVPLVIYGLWKNAAEIIDRVTSPDIVATAPLVSFRCIYERTRSHPNMDLDNCKSGRLAVSSLITFQSLDRIPRSVVKIELHLSLVRNDDTVQNFTFVKTRYVKHEITNYVETVKFSEWASLNLGILESEVVELVFSAQSSEENYGAFLNTLYGDETGVRYTQFSIETSLFVLGEPEPISGFSCAQTFDPAILLAKPASRQNQFTFKCGEE